jgi:hypothetical protein
MSKRILGRKHWLQFNKDLAKATSVHAALLLSELIDSEEQVKYARKLQPDGSFYKSAEELEEELCLTKHERQVAAKILQDKGLITVSLRSKPDNKFEKISFWQLHDDNINKFMAPIQKSSIVCEGQKDDPPEGKKMTGIPDSSYSIEEIPEVQEPNSELLKKMVNTFATQNPKYAYNTNKVKV